MAEFLTTLGISYQIENIIKEAKNKLILVSPYLQLSSNFYDRLSDASKKGVRIIIIYGKDELSVSERNILGTLSNLELYFHQDLHAKCYFNEKRMVITSMNMYEYSQRNNREMGVLIVKENDADLFQQAVDETLSILNASDKVAILSNGKAVSIPHQNPEVPKQTNKQKSRKTPQKGYCIRCEERIPYDPEKPYCYACFMVWSMYENPHYQECVCHCCGEHDDTSMAKPECYDCYTEVSQPKY